jgi:hypothetical protein
MPQIPQDQYQSLALDLGTAQTSTMKFPKLIGARIYISSGQPITVCCDVGVGYPPAPSTSFADGLGCHYGGNRIDLSP